MKAIKIWYKQYKLMEQTDSGLSKAIRLLNFEETTYGNALNGDLI